MWPDRVSNPGPLTYESGALLTATAALRYTCYCTVSVIGQFFFPAKRIPKIWLHDGSRSF